MGSEMCIRDSGSSGGLSDPLLRLYQNGQLIVEDDDAGPGLDPRVIFTAPTTGPYYLEVASPETQSGEYLLDVTNLSSPTITTERAPLTQTIDWGTTVGTNSIDVYFAVQGESFGAHSSLGWTDAEIEQVMLALAQFEAVTDLTFNRVQSPENAEFKLVIGSPPVSYTHLTLPTICSV